MSTRYPGWFLTVDGKPAPLLNVGGFLATTLQPGVHRYEFAFSPAPFNAGLVISLLAMLVLLVLSWPGLRRARLRILGWGCALPARLPALPSVGKPSTGSLAGSLGAAPESPPASPAESPADRLAADGQAVPMGEARWRITARAVYQGGILKPDRPLDLPDDTDVRLTVEPLTPETPSLPAGAELSARRQRMPFSWGAGAALPGRRPWAGHRLSSGAAGRARGLSLAAGRLSAVVSLEWVLFGLALLVYAVTRLFALDRFPIYFFADEATHAVLAEQLLQTGFRDAHGTFLPLYFEAAGNRWTPLLSVYVHAFSVFLFGKSIIVTRATSAVVSIFGTAAVGLILKRIFKVRAWWLGVLFMAIAPAWFIHTRTGFETAMMSSFYVCFLLFYLLYRTRSPRFLFPALLFGGATFYTYSNGQMVMAAAGVCLILSDIRYHLRNWRTALAGAVLLAVLMVPLIAFRLGQPAAMSQHLRAIDSYWFRAMPLQDKVIQFIKNYTYGLSPAYWFVPNGYDLVRHRLMGYGNLSIVTLPLFLIGLGVCLWRFRSSPHRAVVLAALAAPVGAALVDISITRVLAFIGPACLLTALGLDWLMGWLARRRVPYGAVAGAAFVVLSFGSIGMLHDALTDGPLWYRDYGLYGMQYGAKQLFAEAIPEYLARDSNTQIMMTSTWANGSDIFIRFFLRPEQRTHVLMLNIDFFMDHKAELNPNMVLVMTPSEYQQAVANAKFKAVTVEKVIPYPDGSPGFYFARLAYADNVDAVFAAEEAARRQPVVEQIVLDGQPVTVAHSQFEAGQLKDLFDGDPFTLVRGREANPLVIEFSFSQPRALSGLTAVFGTMDFTLTAKLYADPNAEPVVYEQTYRNLPSDPKVELSFGPNRPQTVSKLRLEIKHLTAGPQAKIHVRELAFK